MTTEEDRRSREEIRELMARYNLAVDARDEAWLDCFAPDGALDTGNAVVEGREQLGAMLVGLGKPGEGVVRHFAVNEVIDVQGDHATMRCAFLGRVKTRDGRDIVATGTYDDVLRRDDGNWRFVRRTFRPD